MVSMQVYPHAVAKLLAVRKANSTRPFLARGHQVKRCERCRLGEGYCICQWQPSVDSEVGMCLLMYDSEPFKPSNTGWLIADVVQHTFAFSWSRVGEMREVKDLLSDPQWQPYVVFPGEYAAPDRVTEEVVVVDRQKKPLFILLDATWPEARKMFRKSHYLDHLPVLSLRPSQQSRYKLRRSCNTEHLCTAEVAALCLELAGEVEVCSVLNSWLDLFTEHYLASKQNRSVNTRDELYSKK